MAETLSYNKLSRIAWAGLKGEKNYVFNFNFGGPQEWYHQL